MKIRVKNLEGAALDWAVAQCEDFIVRDGFDDECPEYSTNWCEGGPIIEREQMDLRWRENRWIAMWWADNSEMARIPSYKFQHNQQIEGPTPLIAAMRAYVASQMGQEIDIPEELA